MTGARIGFVMPPRIARHRRAHWRLGAAVACGVAAAALTWTLDPATRALIGWDVAAVVLLLGIVRAMNNISQAELERIACKEDESASVILVLTISAIVASLVGVVVEIGAARNADVFHATLFTSLGVATILLSWFSMHTSFALHYAHHFYGDRDRNERPDGGLAFPAASGRASKPGYVEFIYFAFCLGMTCQVSDVAVQGRGFRTLVTLHGVLSFFYNIFILGLAVSLFSTLSAP